MRINSSDMDIRIDDLSSPEIAAFLTEHLRDLAEVTPPESRHALNLEELRQSDLTFWSVWRGKELVGCGALKKLGATHGEIKSMRTAKAYLRQGIAEALLSHIIAEAGNRGYRRLSLETGSSDPFEPARRLYRKFGFTTCPPFASYRADPNSEFMTMELPTKISPSAPLSAIYAFHPIGPRLGTAGQPAEEQFQSIRAAGFRTVINLALPTSDNALAGEGSFVTSLGMSYVHIPVDFKAPSPHDFRAFCRVMQAFEDEPVFVHCAANMRVSAFVFLYRVLHEHVSSVEAERDLHAIWEPDAVWTRFIQEQLMTGSPGRT